MPDLLVPLRASPIRLLAAALLVPWPAMAQPSVGAPARESPTNPSVFHGRLRQLDVVVPRFEPGVTVDGRLTEPAWTRAALLTGFSQYAPVDGVAAVDSTEVLVMYSEHAMYFGIRAFEPHAAVNATLANRDRVGADDFVTLILDTFNDKRRALYFSVNPLGVQSDGVLTEGSAADPTPDFQYESRGHVTETGYEIEVRIPFKSLRFQQGETQDWGINVMRRVQHSGHEITWTPTERGAPSFLAQSGTLRGLTQMNRGVVVDVNPVMTARSTGAPAATTGDWRYRREDPEFGANIKWGLTPNLSLNATVNPDFSQVEADVEQVVYDPRRAISYPEKRPFFLEGSENFQVGNSLIYTRRIVAPNGALKLSGKVGGMNVGVLSAMDDESAVPGSDDKPIYNLMRLRRDLGATSNVGIVYTDRMQGDAFNRVLGIDTRMQFGTRYVFNGQLAASATGSEAMRTQVRPLFDFTLTQTGRATGFTLVVGGIHPEFSAQSGFISRGGIAHANFTPRRTFFPKNSAFESISISPILDGTWDWDRFMAGTGPNDLKVNTQTTATLRGGWTAMLFTWSESFRYPEALYVNYFVERRDDGGAVLDTVPYVGTHRLTNLGVMTRLATPSWKTFSASAELLGGQDDNFDEWSSANVFFATLVADWRPTDRIRVNARYVQQRFHRQSDASLVRLRSIPRLRVEYQLTRAIFLRFVGQHDATRIDALRDDSRTNDPILIRRSNGTFRRADAVEGSGFRADWLFSFQPNPGTVVFAGYGASLGSDEFFTPRDLTRVNDGFFVKLSYLFRM